MKKIFKLFTAVTLVLFLSVSLISCGEQKKKDDLGFNRPDDAWITDCLVLPEHPFADLDQKKYPEDADKLSKLFGKGGENGIVNESAVSRNGTVNAEGQSAYIVYMIYGTDCLGAVPDTYFKLTYLEDKGVSYDTKDGFFTVLAMETYGNIEAELDMNKMPSERLSVKCKSDTVSAAIVIPIRFNSADLKSAKGSVFVDMSVSMARTTMKLDLHEEFYPNGNKVIGDPVAQVTALSVGYLTEKDYNKGNFSDSSISSEALLTSGTPHYMVLDLNIKSLFDNDGTESFRVMTYVSDASTVGMKIQDAPTGTFEELALNGGVRIQAYYTLPLQKNGERTVRMILKLMPVNTGAMEFDIFVFGESKGDVSGDFHRFETLLIN